MAVAWSLNICVQDGAGRPIDSAVVTISESPVPVPDIAALTGLDGRVSLNVPREGIYEITVITEGLPVTVAQLEAAVNGAESNVLMRGA